MQTKKAANTMNANIMITIIAEAVTQLNSKSPRSSPIYHHASRSKLIVRNHLHQSVFLQLLPRIRAAMRKVCHLHNNMIRGIFINNKANTSNYNSKMLLEEICLRYRNLLRMIIAGNFIFIDAFFFKIFMITNFY